MKNELGKRLGPFLALLDAKYAPLLFAVAPQAYAVFDWLHKSGAPDAVAKTGAIGYEMVYVGAIAWADDGESGGWTWLTAVASLLFSIGVAVYTYQDQGYAAWLHAGFPVVAFFYTLQMHAAGKRKRVQPATEGVQLVIGVDRVVQPQPARLTTGATVELKQPTGKLAGIDVVAELAKHGGSKSATATALGVSRAGLDKALGKAVTQ